AIREVVAESLREELRHADARFARRARFPRPDRSGAGAFHRAAAPRHSVKASLLPRRRTLGAEAAELQAVVPDRGGLVRSVLEVRAHAVRPYRYPRLAAAGV